jgi:excisionase family DNA binding protein
MNSNEVIIMKEEFIKLEINIPRNEIKDFIIDVASSLNNTSKKPNTIESQPIILNKKIDTDLFTVSEVARKLKVNTDYVYSLIKNGNLLALKLGSLKIRSTELERFLKYAEGKDFTDLNTVKELQSDK